MPYIEISGLHQTYRGEDGTNTPVLQGIDLKIEKGEFVSLFGPNGCGKTTLLYAIAALVSFEAGNVLIGGKKPRKSNIGFVFQNYTESLFPWLKNLDNIAFALKSSIPGKQQRHEFVRSFLIKMGLDALPLDKYPYQCSAGQQQLVALAREIICQPDVLLMDEPFVSLDYERRISQQEYLLRTWQKTGTSILFVSHEIDEAIFLADRLVLLSQRPTRVVKSFEIPLPRPRTLEMVTSREFIDVKVPILRAFTEVIRK